MNKNIRVKEIRKNLNLTTNEFSEKLGVTRSAISNIENGIRNLTEQMITAICNVYNVNEEWLRNGNGEMFIQSKYDILDEFIKMYDLDELDRAIFSEYINLDYKDRKIIKKYIISVIDKYRPIKEPEIIETDKERINREVEAYRKELEDELKGVEKLSALEKQKIS